MQFSIPIYIKFSNLTSSYDFESKAHCSWSQSDPMKNTITVSTYDHDDKPNVSQSQSQGFECPV